MGLLPMLADAKVNNVSQHYITAFVANTLWTTESTTHRVWNA
jgi:hypothetical protein